MPLRFRLSEEIPNETYVDTSVQASVLAIKNSMVTKTHGQGQGQVFEETIATLVEYLASEDENILLNASTCLRLAFSVPMQPLQFHTASCITDYDACIELVGSDNNLICANALGILLFAFREGVGLCMILRSPILQPVLQYVLSTLEEERDHLVVRALKEFVASALASVNDISTDFIHHDLCSIAISTGLYKCAIELCNAKHCRGVGLRANASLQLIDILGRLTENNATVALHLWKDVSLGPLTNFLSSFVKNDHDQNTLGIHNRGMFLGSLRVIHNILASVVSSRCGGKRVALPLLLQRMPIEAVNGVIKFVTAENNSKKNVSSLMYDSRGVEAGVIGTELLWSIALMDGKQEQNGKQQNTAKKFYNLPIVSPLTTQLNFVESIIGMNVK